MKIHRSRSWSHSSSSLKTPEAIKSFLISMSPFSFLPPLVLHVGFPNYKVSATVMNTVRSNSPQEKVVALDPWQSLTEWQEICPCTAASTNQISTSLSLLTVFVSSIFSLEEKSATKWTRLSTSQLQHTNHIIKYIRMKILHSFWLQYLKLEIF